MSNQHESAPFTPPAEGPPAVAQPGFPVAVAPPPRTTNGLSIAGFVLAFLAAPIGLILSVIGLVQANRRGQKGKGLAIAGIVIAVLLTGIGGALIVAAGQKVSKLADPGCTTGKAAVLDNADMSGDATKVKTGLQATINGLNSAAAKAKHDDVRQAMTNLSKDYAELLEAVNTGAGPDPGLQARIDADAKKIDSLCSVGE